MPRGVWPTDRLMIAYLLAIGLLVAAFRQTIPHSGMILLAHAAAIALLAAFAFAPRIPGAFIFRHCYPIVYVFACYRELSVIIPAVRGTTFDATLAAWDFAIWRTHPTVWLERFQAPLLTEFLELAYSLFVPAVLLVAAVLWFQKRWKDFRSYAFLITLGFLVSYVGYVLVPVRGPRFFLAGLQNAPLAGLWLFQPLQVTLDVLESAHYDCFPSGHVELLILAWWASRRISPWLARAYVLYTAVVILATVFLRYHYTVDLIAGIAAAAAVLAVAPPLERRLYGGRSENPSSGG